MIKSLDQILSDEENKLNLVQRRHEGLAAIRAELDRVIGDSEFRVQNDLVWDMVLCAFDMLVIDLASWFKGLSDTGGLLGQIKARLGELPIRRAWKEGNEKRLQEGDSGSDDQFAELSRKWLKNHYNEWYAELHRSLFPGVPSGRTPSATDVDALGQRLWSVGEALVDDRNQNRAHRFERDPKDRATRAAMLDLPEITARLKSALDTLHDLRLLCSGENSARPSWMLPTSAKTAARDVVAQLLIGSDARQRSVLGTLSRDEHYAKLREAREARGGVGLFNEP